MNAYGQNIQDAVSIGLGAGDNRQAAVVSEIAASYPGSHINQVFPAVGQPVRTWELRTVGLTAWFLHVGNPAM